MKTTILLLFLISTTLLMSQSKTNVLDDNLKDNYPVIIYERIDGSIFELNGKTTWTVHKLLSSSLDFADFVNAKKPRIVEFETIDGSQYSNKNGGNWKKSKKRFEPEGSLSFSASYRQPQKMIEVLFTISNTTLVEISLHSVYGENRILLHSKIEPIGQHRLLLPVSNVTKGEYVLVLRTPERVETVRISINN
jgi:hypothetical protein